MSGKSRQPPIPIPPFNEFLGTRIISRDNGRCEVALDLAAHHKNRRGVAHGGVVCSLLDSALGAAVVSTMAPEEWCATMQMSISFVDGPREGTLTAVGRVVRRGRRVAFAAGELLDESGRVLATAQGVWYIWPRLPETAPRAGATHDPRDPRGPGGLQS